MQLPSPASALAIGNDESQSGQQQLKNAEADARTEQSARHDRGGERNIDVVALDLLATR
jgi:hypothetical protein